MLSQMYSKILVYKHITVKDTKTCESNVMDELFKNAKLKFSVWKRLNCPILIAK